MEEADRKIDRLIELQLSSAALPENVFKAKLQALQEEKARWEALKQQNTVDEHEFEISVEEVLDLAKNAAEIFMSSQMAQKKQILNCVFANLTMKQKNLYFLYKKPFDLLVKGSLCPKTYQIDEKLLPEYVEAVIDQAVRIRILKVHLTASGILVNWCAGRLL